MRRRTSASVFSGTGVVANALAERRLRMTSPGAMAWGLERVEEEVAGREGFWRMSFPLAFRCSETLRGAAMELAEALRWVFVPIHPLVDQSKRTLPYSMHA